MKPARFHGAKLSPARAPTAKRRRPSIASHGSALLVGASLLLASCAAPSAVTRERLVADLGTGLRSFPVYRADTKLEKDAAIRHPTTKRSKSETAFLVGVITGTIGVAGVIGFGATGRATENRLRDGYETGIDRQTESNLQSRGNAMNKLTGAAVGVGLVGYAVSLVAYVIDYNRCGPLTRKNARRDCPR